MNKVFYFLLAGIALFTVMRVISVDAHEGTAPPPGEERPLKID